MIPWQEILHKSAAARQLTAPESPEISTLKDLKSFLDLVHIRHCLVKPYQEIPDYPLVEGRELLPSFETDMYEYKNLPAFALVAFNRKLDYFQEIFQFDKLHPLNNFAVHPACFLKDPMAEQNLQILTSRLPKLQQIQLKKTFNREDLTSPEYYSRLMPFLLAMDRAHVLALNEKNQFHLAGIYASFPSDIDSELKRFGIRIGKFVYGDNEMYERNRMFVYQYFMELYGFPVVSERRTSSALFARKLHKMGENFIIRVLGQTDRIITTFISNNENRRYPRIEKIALVTVAKDQKEALDIISQQGFFLDKERRAVIMRITYRQHRYNPDNLRQDRALSVASQEILHPLTGEILTGINIIKDPSNIYIRLNDIVRGEYAGKILYKRTEVVENTDTDEKRLKFLYAWLIKHKRRMITYNDEFFLNVNKVINSYLQDPEKGGIFDSMRDQYLEVCSILSYIQQARRVRILQDVAARKYKGRRINYREMSREAVKLLAEIQYDLANFFPHLVDTIIKCVEEILHDAYLQRHYLDPPENTLTESGKEIKKNYGRLVALLDSIKAIRKSRFANKTKTAQMELFA